MPSLDIVGSVSDDDLWISMRLVMDFVNSYACSAFEWLRVVEGMNMADAKATLEVSRSSRVEDRRKHVRAVLDTDLMGFPFDQPRYWFDVLRLADSTLGIGETGGPLLRRVESYACEEIAHIVKRKAEWWTTQEAAHAMQVSESYVRRMARTGRVAARRHPTDSWRIWSPSVRRFCK